VLPAIAVSGREALKAEGADKPPVMLGDALAAKELAALRTTADSLPVQMRYATTLP